MCSALLPPSALRVRRRVSTKDKTRQRSSRLLHNFFPHRYTLLPSSIQISKRYCSFEGGDSSVCLPKLSSLLLVRIREMFITQINTSMRCRSSLPAIIGTWSNLRKLHFLWTVPCSDCQPQKLGKPFPSTLSVVELASKAKSHGGLGNCSYCMAKSHLFLLSPLLANVGGKWPTISSFGSTEETCPSTSLLDNNSLLKCPVGIGCVHHDVMFGQE